MKRDIRELFKTNEEDKMSLPDGHRVEFLDKLEVQGKDKKSRGLWLRVAAVIAFGLTVGFSLLYKDPIKTATSPIVAQIEQVEAEYLKDIETEWNEFVSLTDDAHLIERFRNRLDDLDTDYNELSKAFLDNTNDIITVEALVNNLKTRLQILKDIQEHIKILNQKSEPYEKSI